MSTGMQYRQGDVLLIPAPSLPERAQALEGQSGRVVLALGEVTGHSHTMGADRVRYFREDGSGRGFIQVFGPGTTALVHEEHGPIEVEPGVYEVRLQREYRPEARPSLVAD
ncbi:hypothetical protein [Arenibaculum pallidiluteum]|uniref:hypothetical protein n=1 Tax=Arenibaculum pallidiluteum TaxID=2812559 RepID=UPI001A97093A|nr:hypothetical protein [Arenibaculum pallidiluteum]